MLAGIGRHGAGPPETARLSFAHRRTRPQWSLLAIDGDGSDVGFIACGEGWIVQVGVRPDRRGRRLGAAPVAEAQRRMRAAGEAEALLDVNVDNPAGELYRRLGFTGIGRRARFSAS